MEIRHRDVQAEVRIHVAETGPLDGKPILFLHGFPEFWWSWRHQLEHFGALGYRCAAMDLRGYGDSEFPPNLEDYHAGHSVGDIAAVIETLGGSATLVGHDWGGSPCWATAAYMPNIVDRLVILNSPHPAAFARTIDHIDQLKASWYMLLFQFEGVAERYMSRNNFSGLRDWAFATASNPIPGEVVDVYVEKMSRPGALTAALNWYRATLPPEQLVGGAAPELPAITVPTMVLWGLDDAYLTAEIGRMSGEFCSGPYVYQEIPNCGHWVQQERPEVVNEALESFLNA